MSFLELNKKPAHERCASKVEAEFSLFVIDQFVDGQWRIFSSGLGSISSIPNNAPPQTALASFIEPVGPAPAAARWRGVH